MNESQLVDKYADYMPNGETEERFARDVQDLADSVIANERKRFAGIIRSMVADNELCVDMIQKVAEF